MIDIERIINIALEKFSGTEVEHHVWEKVIEAVEFVADQLRTAEQERDQYKSERDELSGFKANNAHIQHALKVNNLKLQQELESLRAKRKELESLKFFMELHENGYFIPIEGQNFEFTKD